MSKQKYWRNSLIFIIVFLGIVIFYKLIPFLGGLLGAMTIYILIRNQMFHLCDIRHMRKGLAAAILLIETILIFLIPISLIIWIFLSSVKSVAVDPQSIIQPIEQFAGNIQDKIGYDILSKDNTDTLISILPKIAQFIMGGLASFAINVIVLIFVLYFMLIGGHKMEAFVADILPFNKENKKSVLHEFNMVVKSNAIGVPVLALIQGAVATGGYFIFGAPAPLIMGFLSAFATVIPIIGVGLIWIPLALYLGLNGSWGNAIGLVIYSLVLVSNSDNVIRFLLQKHMANIHPLITIFGVVIGLSLFGFMGVIFGPLMLSIFVLCIKIFKREYFDSKSS